MNAHVLARKVSLPCVADSHLLSTSLDGRESEDSARYTAARKSVCEKSSPLNGIGSRFSRATLAETVHKV